MNAVAQKPLRQLEKIPGGYFDAAEHAYYDEAGARVPGTTSLLEAAGFVCYQHIPPRILERKAEIGTAAHAAAHYYDEGDLNESTVDPQVTPYVTAWKKFRHESDFVPELLEFRGIAIVNCGGRLFLKHGWTLDRKGSMRIFGRTKRVLLEIKCTANQEVSWGPQTASYEMASRSLHASRQEPCVRVAVWLRPNETYRLILLSDVSDYQIWKVALRAGWEKDPAKRDRLLVIARQWMESKGKTVEANDEHANHAAD